MGYNEQHATPVAIIISKIFFGISILVELLIVAALITDEFLFALAALVMIVGYFWLLCTFPQNIKKAKNPVLLILIAEAIYLLSTISLEHSLTNIALCIFAFVPTILTWGVILRKLNNKTTKFFEKLKLIYMICPLLKPIMFAVMSEDVFALLLWICDSIGLALLVYGIETVCPPLDIINELTESTESVALETSIKPIEHKKSIVLPPEESPTSEKRTVSENQNKLFCIYCGKEIVEGFDYCKNCGRSTTCENQRHCVCCGTILLNDGQQYCANCGKKVSNETHRIESDRLNRAFAKIKQLPRKVVAIIVAAVILLIAIFCIPSGAEKDLTILKKYLLVPESLTIYEAYTNKNYGDDGRATLFYFGAKNKAGGISDDWAFVQGNDVQFQSDFDKANDSGNYKGVLSNADIAEARYAVATGHESWREVRIK